MAVDFERMTEKLAGMYADEAVRNAQCSNEKLDKLAGILMQIGFAMAGLGAARVVGHFGELPLSLCGVIASVVSIIAGGVQFFVDYRFFTKGLLSSRKVASLALGAWMRQDAEMERKFRDAVDVHGEQKDESNYAPLIAQTIFLLCAACLIFAELNKSISN